MVVEGCNLWQVALEEEISQALCMSSYTGRGMVSSQDRSQVRHETIGTRILTQGDVPDWNLPLTTKSS